MLCHATGDTIPGLTLRTTRVIVVRPKDPGQGVNVNTIQIWALVILVLLQQTRSAACDINSTTVTSSKNKFRLAHVQSNVLSTAFLLSDLCHLALGAHKVTPAVKSPQAKAVSSTLCAADLGNFSGGPAKTWAEPTSGASWGERVDPAFKVSSGRRNQVKWNEGCGSSGEVLCPTHYQITKL